MNYQDNSYLNTPIGEKDMRVILENLPQLVMLIDLDGIIQYWNGGGEKIFGYKASEIVGKSVWYLYPDRDPKHFDMELVALKKGESISFEVKGKHKDGSGIWVDEKRNIIENSLSEPVILSTASDISLHKKAGFELAASQARAEAILETDVFIRDISDRRKLENEILKIAEDERRAIGQELHDSLGQMLSGIGLISRNLARKFKANGLPAADEVVEIAKMIKEADELARNIAHGLAHIELENEGLKIATQRLCERFEKVSDIQCKCEFLDDIPNERQNLSLHLYRIVQEALNNAMNHGEAKNVSVCLKVKESYLQLLIEDDGIGFPDEEKIGNGMGIKTMRYRAHTLGGNLKINRTSDGWTQIVCTVPINNLQDDGQKYGV